MGEATEAEDEAISEAAVLVFAAVLLSSPVGVTGIEGTAVKGAVDEVEL